MNAAITSFAPVLVALIAQYRSRNEVITEDVILQAFHDHVAAEKAKGAAWAQTHPDA